MAKSARANLSGLSSLSGRRSASVIRTRAILIIAYCLRQLSANAAIAASRVGPPHQFSAGAE
jgi:hypothetical protein